MRGWSFENLTAFTEMRVRRVQVLLQAASCTRIRARRQGGQVPVAACPGQSRPLPAR